MTGAPRCLVTEPPRPEAAQRLVVFPHAGGGASFYRPWRRLLDPGIELQVVQYPGRETRMDELLVSDAADLADEVAEALRATDDGSRTTVLLGHSMGAIIAYETAIALDGTGGTPPIELFVSARNGPGAGVAESAARPGPPSPRTDDEILTSLRRYGGTPMEAFDDPAFRELALRVLRNDYLLVDSYRPAVGRCLRTTGITALWGSQDPAVNADLIRLWKRRTAGDFHEHMFEGGHFYLVPHRQRVLELIRARFRATADAV